MESKLEFGDWLDREYGQEFLVEQFGKFAFYIYARAMYSRYAA